MSAPSSLRRRSPVRSTLAILFLAASMGCGADKDEGSDSAGTTTGGGSGTDTDTADTDTPPMVVHESGFGLVVDDGMQYAWRTSTAEYAVHIDADTVSGFVRYAEQNADGTETCAAVLTVRPSSPEVDPHASDTAVPPADPCTDCTYHYAHTDLAVTSGTCTFGAELTALDQAASYSLLSTELLFMVDSTDQLTVEVREYGADPTTAGVEVPLTAAGTATFDGTDLSGSNAEESTSQLYWQDCSSPGYGTTNTLVPGQLSLADALACPAGAVPGEPVVDIWEREVEFGQTLNVGVSSAGDFVQLFLRDPAGCLVDLRPSPESCLGSTESDCQSIEHTVTVGGSYAALVLVPFCDAAGTAYQFDARVQ